MSDLTTLSQQELFDLYYNKTWELVQKIKTYDNDDFYMPDDVLSAVNSLIEINDQRLKLG
jgi:hypothetical protein